ncbi:hypothetical protein N7466_010751 [Penicillium verhagenii]|uniref:uncharacterized protein n=1 Tax=Penicillium verhagenii TaxID=1562060 RepID=UPI0025451213|nr:uncharacterized protein N7466_010751 [Penicillium verhagenii]KAJ5917197.1 hypothetical protein N7466_010751 [Penicillium verhagenii]
MNPELDDAHVKIMSSYSVKSAQSHIDRYLRGRFTRERGTSELSGIDTHLGEQGRGLATQRQ